MTIRRRGFLSGLVTGAGTALGATSCRTGATPVPGALAAEPAPAIPPPEPDLSTWEAVRAQFLLTREYVHMALMLLASHPRPVREAIDRHRRGLDEDPVSYGLANFERLDKAVREAAGAYVGGRPEDIALTGNTTTGLAMLYGGLPLRPGQEIVTTTHDHYSTHESLRLRAVHTGTSVRKVSLYAQPGSASEDEIVGNTVKAVGPRTRALAVTWVHSSTGVKLPIRAMAAALGEVNKRRDADDRVLLCVDGVHAFGVEDFTVGDLGCDFLVTGCHKWLFGPRGTGLVHGRPEAWKGHAGLIPTFDWAAYQAWMRGEPPDALPPGPRTSPGGFHTFEYRWALAEAFTFHQRIGKARVAARIHALAGRCKDGLAAIPKVRLHTPRATSLSAGIVCFEVGKLPADDVVRGLRDRKIIASETPYATSYARLTPGVLNSEEEVDRAVAAVAALAQGAA
ncbi:MAG TPA: aminotransferase class V-fold PLP-dependent enzyme [Polyangia bacterium]|nr:aminotransferase class V-fold PLP-dependent enzyme [Polyangia bacterium]